MKNTSNFLFAVLFILFLCIVHESGLAQEPVWTIGTADNDAREFKHAPDEFDRIESGPSYVIGSSTPEQDWPYAHPGPADDWAGKRSRSFSVFFVLSDRPEKAGRFIIDCAAIHPDAPPTVRISLNGNELDAVSLPSGTENAPVHGDLSRAREHVIEVNVPAELLRTDVNHLNIRNQSGSWFLYDQVRFEAGGGTATTALPDQIITGVHPGSRIMETDRGPEQPVNLQILNLNEEMDVRLRVNNSTFRRTLDHGRQTISLSLPASDTVRKRTVRLTRNDRTIHRFRFRMPAGRDTNPVDWADPLIGAAESRWILHPGPARPFGMVKLAPDNEMGKTLSSGGNRYGGGFDPGRNWIHGFSHLHSWTISGLSLMPRTGSVTNQRTPPASPDTYPSIYDRSSQNATPAHYEVRLPEQDIHVEMTPTTRAAIHRYTFPESDSAHVIVTFAGGEYGAEIKEAEIRRVSNREIAGYVRMDNNYFRNFQQYTHYFVLQFDTAFKRMAGWSGNEQADIDPDAQQVSGNANRFGVAPVFRTDAGETIRVKTGISFVSIDSARNNLSTEIGSFDTEPHGWDYEEVRQEGRDEWNKLFGRIDVSFPTGDQRQNRLKFYTNLYRAYSSRTIMSDVNGKYTDMFENARQLDNPHDPMLGSDAFWNTFWNLNQLWTIATPDVTRKWVRSLLRTFEDGGWLPKGPAGLEYSGIMRGVHSIPLIVSAYQHDIRNFNHETAYEAMKHALTTPGKTPAPGGGGSVGARNLSAFIQHGYVPSDRGRTSDTMEYAYDSWCLGTFADALGHRDDAETFFRRAGYWRNTFDEDGVKYLRRKKADGSWAIPASAYDPHTDKSVTEGTLWQYSWFVPHDVPSLVEVMGRKKFVRRLNEGLQQAEKSDFHTGHRGDFNRGVNHGNQPNMQAAYLFNYAGKPWLTQKWVRAIMDQYYGTGPDAWPGDEDQGQMGGWFVMSALGLFQTDGGCRKKPIYEIGSPLVSKATITLNSSYYSGNTFTIRAKNNSSESVYIQSAEFNGETLTKPWIRAERLLNGGKLVLEMGPEPNRKWASGMENAPPAPSSDTD